MNDEQQNQDSQAAETYVTKDAYWDVRPTDYVSPFPPLASGLLDDPNRLKDSWHRALVGFQQQAELDDKQQQAVIQHAESLFQRPTVLPAVDQPPSSGFNSQSPRRGLMEMSKLRLATVGLLARLLGKLRSLQHVP